MTRSASPTKSSAKSTPSQVISNQILNGDQSTSGVGLPTSTVDLDLSQIIVSTASTSSQSSKSTTARNDALQRAPLSRALERSPRRKSPVKNKPAMRMQFADSDSEDEGGAFSGLKVFYPALNAVEQCSLIQYYSRGDKCVFLSQSWIKNFILFVRNFYHSRQIYELFITLFLGFLCCQVTSFVLPD